MPDYRRHRVPGGTYFFTLALANRQRDLLVREVAALRAAVIRTRRRCGLFIARDAHLDAHLDAHQAVVLGGDPGWRTRSDSRVAKGERGIWQRRFWEHTVRDPDDFARHGDYVHFNPVKHGLVARIIERPHSSFRRAVARGDYPADWARADDGVGGFGEVAASPTDFGVARGIE